MLLIFLAYATAPSSPNNPSRIAFRTDHENRNAGSEILESLSRNGDDRCGAGLKVLDEQQQQLGADQISYRLCMRLIPQKAGAQIRMLLDHAANFRINPADDPELRVTLNIRILRADLGPGIAKAAKRGHV